MTFFTDLRSAVAKRAAYHRTVRELRAMPLETAQDLDLFHEDAPLLARRAVYGN